jgi:MFS family permease
VDASTETAASEERFFGGYQSRIFLGVTLGWAVVVFGRQLLPPLLPAIIADLAITPFQAGAAVTVMWMMRALTQYPGGRLADALSRKTVLVGSLVVLVSGFVVLSGAASYAVFVLAVAIVGTGAGSYSVSTRATVADIYVAKRGQAYGIVSAFNNVSGVGAAGGATLIIAVATWRSAFLPAAAALVLIAVALHVGYREPYVFQRVDFAVTDTARRLFGDATIRRIVAAYVLYLFAWQGFIAFLPAFLQADRGLSPAVASAGFGLVYVVGVVAGPVTGVVADRFGKLLTVLWVSVCAIGGLAALLATTSLVSIGASVVVLALGFRSVFPIMQAYLMDAFADESMAGDLGASKAVWGMAASFGPSYVGLVAGWWSYPVAFAGLIGCLVLALSLVVVVEYVS